MMETSLMVDDYPTPQENTKTIKGSIVLTYTFEMEVPESWDKERIEQDIKENKNEYLQELDEINEIII